jgi:hypothetical protein
MNGPLAVKRQVHKDGEAASGRDPLYLFTCHLEWRNHKNVRAFEELLAALDDPNEEVVLVAESLLGRRSPRRRCAPNLDDGSTHW